MVAKRKQQNQVPLIVLTISLILSLVLATCLLFKQITSDPFPDTNKAYQVAYNRAQEECMKASGRLGIDCQQLKMYHIQYETKGRLQWFLDFRVDNRESKTRWEVNLTIDPKSYEVINTSTYNASCEHIQDDDCYSDE